MWKIPLHVAFYESVRWLEWCSRKIIWIQGQFCCQKQPASPKREVCLGHILRSQAVRLTWMSFASWESKFLNSPGPPQLLSAAMRFLPSDFTFSFLYVSGCIWLPTSASQPATPCLPPARAQSRFSISCVYSIFHNVVTNSARIAACLNAAKANIVQPPPCRALPVWDSTLSVGSD